MTERAERVLYMEDDAAQARLVKKCLERAGYLVDVAGDGTSGLAQYEANSYTAVIVDQTMPGCSGLEVLRTMTAHGSPPPTIMVTGTGDEKIAVQAMKLGVSDYLVKDFEGGFVSVLPLVVQRAIDQRRMLMEKQRMEQELAHAQKMKAIGQLAAGMAHEINTPNQYIADNARFLQDAFSDISGLLDSYDQLLQAAQKGDLSDELLKKVESRVRSVDLNYLTTEIPQAIQQSLEGVEHVASIVSAMKEYTHPDAGRKQPTDLNHAIESALVMCCNEWKYVADVVTDFDVDLPLVQCLPSDINRVIMNLVVNAAHATAETIGQGDHRKHTITVRTRRDGPWAEIRVEDQGAGISEEIRDRVFDPFFTTKDVGQGTGQGLSIAHAIVVDKHGGMIYFESEVGRGTTFVVCLPINGHAEPMSDVSEIAQLEEIVI